MRQALRERAILLKVAPHLVKPLQFLLPMYGWKSRVLYSTGLWLYDRLAGEANIGTHRALTRDDVARIEPALSREGLKAGALFWDASVQSARMVLENVLDAMRHGAIAVNYMKAVEWRRGSGGGWRVGLQDRESGEDFTVHTRKIVEATGAWSRAAGLRLVRGSHIIVPRLTSSENAIAHFEPSGRIVFFIPWGAEGQLSLVGTTDVDHSGGPDRVQISAEERDYLLGVAKKLFGIRPEVISAFSSLRPLLKSIAKSATSTSREHRIWNSENGILHIAGGKYTTYRLMSEEVADLVCSELAPPLKDVHPTRTAVLRPPEASLEMDRIRHLSDYLFVSTYEGYERQWSPEGLRTIAGRLAPSLGWSNERIEAEVEAVLSSQAVVESRTV